MPSSKKMIYQGKIIKLTENLVQLPDGSSEWQEWVEHPGGAVVLALNDHNEICLLKQYRGIVDEWIWELPAGKIDNKEAPIETAKRELAEEAGIEASQWISLGTYLSSPGVFSEAIYMYMVKDIKPGKIGHDANEYIQVNWISLDEARQYMLDNTIKDGKTIACISKAILYLDTE